AEKNYKYIDEFGYYIEDTQAENLYHILLIKQVGDDSYFYYLSNIEENDFLKGILKRVKNSGVKIKKIRNDELKSVFHQDAVLIKNNAIKNMQLTKTLSKSDIKTKYDFSDAAQAKFDAQANKYGGLKIKNRKTISENKNTTLDEPTVFEPQETDINISSVQNTDAFHIPFSELKGRVVHLPKGVIIDAVLQSAISSNSIMEKDVITAVLERDWMYNGNLIAPSGSILYGTVVDAQKAGYAYGNGEIEIRFTEVLSMDGQRFSLPDNSVKLETGINRTVKVTSRVVGGAIMGVVAGTLYALVSGGDVASGVAVGASIGGAGGAVSAVAQKGQDVEIPMGTPLQIKLKEPMTVTPTY
ncbi:hypothetical protein IJE86_09155, partial [bacterium]|nr:hypothetical protein [bacterium]